MSVGRPPTRGRAPRLRRAHAKAFWGFSSESVRDATRWMVLVLPGPRTGAAHDDVVHSRRAPRAQTLIVRSPRRTIVPTPARFGTSAMQGGPPESSGVQWSEQPRARVEARWHRTARRRGQSLGALRGAHSAPRTRNHPERCPAWGSIGTTPSGRSRRVRAETRTGTPSSRYRRATACQFPRGAARRGLRSRRCARAWKFPISRFGPFGWSLDSPMVLPTRGSGSTGRGCAVHAGHNAHAERAGRTSALPRLKTTLGRPAVRCTTPCWEAREHGR